MKLLMLDKMIEELAAQVEAQVNAVNGGNEKAEPWLAIAAGALHACITLEEAHHEIHRQEEKMRRSKKVIDGMWSQIIRLFEKSGKELPYKDIPGIVENEEPPTEGGQGGPGDITLN